EIEEKRELVHFVMELAYARAPLSSKNPILQQVLQNKTKMIVLMKRDLADQRKTEKWIAHFKEKNVPAIAVNVNDKADIKRVIQLGRELGQEKMDKLMKKGIQPRPARAIITEYQNVGKSTLID